MTDSLNDYVRKRIKEERLARGLSRLALAKRCGTSSQNIDRWEAGERYLALYRVEQIANGLKCDVRDLLPQPDDWVEANMKITFEALSPEDRVTLLRIGRAFGPAWPESETDE